MDGPKTRRPVSDDSNALAAARSNVERAVDLAFEERVGERRAVGDESEGQLLHQRRAVPVVLVGGEHDLAPRGPALELERTGAHQLAARGSERRPLGLAHGFAQHGARAAREGVAEGGVRSDEAHRHLVLAGDLDAALGRDQHEGAVERRRDVGAVAFEAVDDVFGGDGGAVPERHVRADVDDERHRIDPVRRLGDARLDGEVGLHAQQAVAQVGLDEVVVGARYQRAGFAFDERPGDLVDLGLARGQCVDELCGGGRLVAGRRRLDVAGRAPCEQHQGCSGCDDRGGLASDSHLVSFRVGRGRSQIAAPSPR